MWTTLLTVRLCYFCLLHWIIVESVNRLPFICSACAIFLSASKRDCHRCNFLFIGKSKHTIDVCPCKLIWIIIKHVFGYGVASFSSGFHFNNEICILRKTPIVMLHVSSLSCAFEVISQFDINGDYQAVLIVPYYRFQNGEHILLSP